MGRNKKNDSEILVKFAREYFETEGEGNVARLKCSNFARYAEKHGSDAKAYDFRRDKAVSDFIEDMKKRAGGDNDVVSMAYRTLDIDALLIKSRNVNEFKKCIRELDEYWKSVYEASVNAEKENKKLKSDKADAQELLEARYENNRMEVRIRELERDNRHLTLACRFMRKMLKKYLYPSVANELLKQEKIPVTEDGAVCADAFDELIEAKFPEAFKGIRGTVQEHESKQDRLFRVMEEQVKDGFK